jgi:glycosyltransferase involved in cell wall biosynthesis
MWRSIRYYQQGDIVRIAQIAPLERRVPPTGYSGIELVVSLLTEELVRRGHEVTLFASGDSVTKAHLHSVYPQALKGVVGLPNPDYNATVYRILNITACLEQAHTFDIIHNHLWPEAIALMANFVKTPMLLTLHCPIDEAGLAFLSAYKQCYNTISKSQKAGLPDRGFVGVIYNAIDCKSYPFGPERREGYLLFLSRICMEKGTHIAIEVARRLRRRLIITGNVNIPYEDRGYFSKMVEPEIDGDLIQYFGEANYYQKRELLANADCLLAPITWGEPFGLFMVEAMACGTPVIVFDHGAAPEVVLHGKTGFIVNSLDEMVEAVGEVHRIDRRLCREHAERHFDVPRMVDDYLAAYERILEMGRSVIKASANPFDLPPYTAGEVILDKKVAGKGKIKLEA